MRDETVDDYLDIVEAGRLLRVTPNDLYRLIKQGRIPAKVFAGKCLIARDELDRFASSR